MVINTDAKRRIRLKELEEEEILRQEKENEEKKNSNFVMLYKDYIDEVLWLSRKSGVSFSILGFIIQNMDNYNALVCSYKVFEEKFKISSETVRKSIKLLKENGFIDVLKSGTNNVYVINPKIAWSSWENQKKYCKFNGNILISQAENKNFNTNSSFEKLKTLKTRENINIFNFSRKL